MKYFEFRKIASASKPDRPAQYWSSSSDVAQYLYKQLKGKPITNKEIKQLWKTTGPDNWANRFMFKPDYTGIKSHYNMMNLGMHHVAQEVEDRLNKLGEMTEDELELEDSFIKDSNQRNFKEDSDIEFNKISNNESEQAIELFKPATSKYKL